MGSITLLPERVGYCDDCGVALAETNESILFLCPECESKIEICAVCKGELGDGWWGVDVGKGGANICGNCHAGVCQRCGQYNKLHEYFFDESSYTLSFLCASVSMVKDESKRDKNIKKRQRRALRGK